MAHTFLIEKQRQPNVLPHRSFAELLRNYMDINGATHAELARGTHIRRETLSRWTAGEVRRPRQRENILQCARYLNLTEEQSEELCLAAGFSPEHVVMPSPQKLPFSFAPLRRSPFIIGPPITEPQQFFGRDYLLKRIFDVWRCTPLQHIAVVGAKRSGKTSLLHYLRKIIDTDSTDLRPAQRNNWLTPGYQWVFVDFQDPRMCYQESLLRHILVEMNMPVPEPCDLVSFMEIIDQYLECPTIILLDEINAGLASPDLDEQFWWGLRSLGSNYAGGKLGFLMTAHQAPEELMLDHSKPSPFFNIFGHVLTIDAWTEEDALAFINSAPPVSFEQADIDWIMQHSGQWPALVQILCHSRHTALEEDDHSDTWKQEGLRRIKPYLYLLETP